MLQQTKQKQEFWVILSIVFFGFLGISMPYLIFPSLFLNPTYSILPATWSESTHAIFLGITLAAYPLGQFFGSPILGALSDEYGRKRLITGSLLITAFCNLFTGFAIEWGQLGLLIASRFIAGVMEGNIAIARAMAADIKSMSKHETFGKINAAISIAYLLGPLIGGLLTDKSIWEELTPSTPFYITSILFLVIAGLAVLVLEKRPVNAIREVRTFWQRINIIGRMRVLFINKHLRFLMITFTSFALAVDIFYEFGPVYLTVKWDLDPAQLVYYNGILCIALALGNGWLPSFFTTTESRKLGLLCAISGIALFLVGITWTDSTTLMMALYGLMGLVIGLAVTLITVKISDSVPDNIQGEVMGVQVSLRVFGDAMICIFGGALLLLSSKLILIFAAGMSMVSMLFYMSRR